MKLRFAAAILAFYPMAAQATESPWTGTWKLDPARSSPEADGAPAAYVLAITADRKIRWEIPSIGEVVTGYVDGQPMVVHRTKPTPGLTLSVSSSDPALPHELAYKVAKNGRQLGGGRMILIEGGKAWVDISWATGKEEYGAELVYVRS